MWLADALDLRICRYHIGRFYTSEKQMVLHVKSYMIYKFDYSLLKLNFSVQNGNIYK